MKTRDFLTEVAELVRIQVPDHLKEFRVVGPTGTLVKLHYGDPSVHYEVWVQRRAGIVEVGLHFEGDAAGNARYLAAVERRWDRIAADLGPGMEAERWTDSWTRVHRHLPLGALDEDLVLEVSQRVSAMIRVLEPLMPDAEAVTDSDLNRRS